jgi:hypothetical protein
MKIPRVRCHLCGKQVRDTLDSRESHVRKLHPLDWAQGLVRGVIRAIEEFNRRRLA